MRRSQSSSTGISASQPRRTIFRHLSDDDDVGHRNLLGDPLLLRSPNARAVASGRSLLDRPGPIGSFTASAAATPLPPRRRGTEPILKSCLSSSGGKSSRGSLLGMSSSSSTTTTPAARKENEEFEVATKRNVSFSHTRVREYEVTLGDNPSVSSGAPLSLGWRYDPRERIVSLEEAKDGLDGDGNDNDDGGVDTANSATRSRWQLKLSDRERQSRIASHPDVSMEDLLNVLASVARTKLERKQTLNEAMEAKKRRPSSPRSPVLWIPSLFANAP